MEIKYSKKWCDNVADHELSSQQVEIYKDRHGNIYKIDGADLVTLVNDKWVPSNYNVASVHLMEKVT